MIYSIFQKCIGPHMFQWIRNYVAEVCALPSALLVKSISGVCSPSIPSLTSNGCTADTAREKAECLNSVFASQPCVPNPSFSVPTLPSHIQLVLDSVSFSPDKVESLLSNLDSDSATSPDGISPRVLKPALLLSLTLPLFYSPSRLLKVICHLLGNQQTSLPCIKKVQKQILATTDQSAFSQSSARLWNPSSLQTLNPASSPMA